MLNHDFNPVQDKVWNWCMDNDVAIGRPGRQMLLRRLVKIDFFSRWHTETASAATLKNVLLGDNPPMAGWLVGDAIRDLGVQLPQTVTFNVALTIDGDYTAADLNTTADLIERMFGGCTNATPSPRAPGGGSAAKVCQIKQAKVVGGTMERHR